jgi:hypothetical protein
MDLIKKNIEGFPKQVRTIIPVNLKKTASYQGRNALFIE